MKRIVIVSALLLIAGITHAQQEVTEKKVSYTFINEYGLDITVGVGFTCIFVNGITFEKTQDVVGIGIGFDASFAFGTGFPIFINYRRYFSKRWKIEPLINVAVGTRFELYHSSEDEGNVLVTRTKYSPELYSIVAAGFRKNAFSFTSGVFVKSSMSGDGHNFFGGVEIKFGYTLKSNNKKSDEKE
jgi:hypothetical protein